MVEPEADADDQDDTWEGTVNKITYLIKKETDSVHKALDKKLDNLKKDQKDLTEKVSGMQGGMTSMQEDITSVQGDITSMQTGMANMQGDITRDITDLKDMMTKMMTFMETNQKVELIVSDEH